MKNLLTFVLFSSLSVSSMAQDVMTPQQLIELNRVSPVGISDDGQNVIYRVSKVDVASNKKTSKTYVVSMRTFQKTDFA